MCIVVGLREVTGDTPHNLNLKHVGDKIPVGFGLSSNIFEVSSDIW